jgi:hypothetical protein
MALLIELPPIIEEELAVEASREGVSTSDQAAFLLQLITALTRDGRNTPFRIVVKAYLQQNSLDADRLAGIFEGLMTLCLKNEDEVTISPDQPTSPSIEPLSRDRILSLLRAWRGPEANCSVDHNVAISIHELPHLDRLIQRSGRKNRVSALGKFAHLGLSTEAFIAEKRLETEREDRL